MGKGKDRRDTDGSLSLGLREAFGRVDVSVIVDALLSAEKFCRSEQSVVKTIFVKGVDGNTVVHRVQGHTVVGDSCWIARRTCGSRTTGRRFNPETP